MAGYRIENTIDDEDVFEARYKGFDVRIERQRCLDDDDYGEEEYGYGYGDFSTDYWTPNDGYAYYITVRNWEIPFGTAYDGYWGNAEHTMDEAVEQALLGAQLITADQRKFPVPA